MPDLDYGARYGDRYEDVYDHDGEGVISRCCGVYMLWDPKHEVYFCPKCGRVTKRTEFLDEYVEAYRPERYSCRTNFPQCVICHKNHQRELDEREDYLES